LVQTPGQCLGPDPDFFAGFGIFNKVRIRPL
jgi:hypothetical protein